MNFLIVKFVFLSCIIILCFVTCFSDAYSRRWRSLICNLFFPDISMARGRYLYAKIVAGRLARKVKLKSIAIREKKRQDFEEENSIGGRMKCCAGMCKCCEKGSKVIKMKIYIYILKEAFTYDVRFLGM